MLTAMTVIQIIISAPIAIYGNIQLAKFKKEMFLQKRSLSILFGLNISCCFQFVVSPMVVIMSVFPESYIIGPVIAISFSSIEVVLFYLNIRNWLIFYRYKWNYYSIHLKWQAIINPKLHQQRNWFLDNQKYGDPQYMLKLFGSIHLILIIIGVIASAIRGIYIEKSEDISTLCTGITILCVIIPIIFYVIIVCKTPSFNDYYFIHWESRMHSKTLIFFISGVIITNIIGRFTSHQVYLVIVGPVFCISFFTMIYISTFALISKHKQALKAENLMNNIATDRIVTLQQVFGNEKALNLFVSHLFTEYVSL